MLNPLAAPQLANTDLVVNYQTSPQAELGNRQVTNFAGRLLSGSSAANYGAWFRAPAGDYDWWAERVGDSRWSYKELLPYFRRTESHYDPNGDPEQHGFQGPSIPHQEGPTLCGIQFTKPSSRQVFKICPI